MIAILMPRRATRFIELAATKKIGAAFKYAMGTGSVVKVTGDPGHGKSTALLHFAEQSDGVYCQVGQTQKTPKGMLRMLVAAYGLYVHGQETLVKLADAVVDGIAHSSRPLIVDEFQTLQPPALRELLSVQETCRIPLILSGNGEALEGRNTYRSALIQIEDRLAMQVNVTGLTPDDCKSIALDYDVSLDAYPAVINYGLRTNVRRLTMMLETCRLVGDQVGQIQLRHIEHSLLSLSGRKDALKLLLPPGEEA